MNTAQNGRHITRQRWRRAADACARVTAFSMLAYAVAAADVAAAIATLTAADAMPLCRHAR